MGKKGAGGRFIERHEGVRMNLVGTAPTPTAADAPIAEDQPATHSKKKVMFQLRDELPGEDPLTSSNYEQNEEEFPALGSRSKNKSRNQIDPQLNSEIETQSYSESTIQPPNPIDDAEDPGDLTKFGVYYSDDYDYSQHLRDPRDFDWGKTYDMCQVDTPKSQGDKKRQRRKNIIKDAIEPEEPCGFIEEETFKVSETEDPEKAEKKFDEFFGDADACDELPDDIMMMLAGAEDCEDEGDWDEQMMEGDCEDHLPHDRVEGQTAAVDYRQMPPLEGYEDRDADIEEDDCSSDVDSNCRDMSDVSEEEEDFENCEDPAMTDSKPFLNNWAEPQTVQSDTNGKPNLDSFFDTMAHFTMDDECSKLSKSNREQLPEMQSSQTVRPSTRGMEMQDSKLEQMMRTEFHDDQLGGDPLEEVGGQLSEMCPQFSAAIESGCGRYQDRITDFLPKKESEEDAATRQKAIAFSKNWRQSKPELIEVSVPDPRSMKYNVGNMPGIRNKNLPSIIKPGELFKKKGRKGLSVKDLKQHDVAMNTPHRDVDEEAQTFKTMLTELSYRPKDETSEERNERKLAVKVIRKARREEKKANTLAQKIMVARVTSSQMNARYNNAIAML